MVDEQARRIGEIVAQRLAETRRGLTQADLAERLVELGVKIDRATIAKIEAPARGKQGRKVTVEDLFHLAAALGVSPLHLLVPLRDEAMVEVTPKLHRRAKTVRAWVRGQRPLREADSQVYYSETPSAEFMEMLEGAAQHRIDLVSSPPGRHERYRETVHRGDLSASESEEDPTG